MLECRELETDRVESGLYNPARPDEPRGHPGWESWLSKEEHHRTEDFIRRVAVRWRVGVVYPLEKGVEPHGDAVARDGT